MLSPGTPAPDLVLADQDGKSFTLSSAWREANVVLFFYPKAGTTVCTMEACAFRDAFADLKARNAIVVGISKDGSEAQRAFASQWQLPFTLLADTSGKAHKAYEVNSLFGLIPGRVTYVIAKGGIIRNAHSALLQSDGHVQDALNALGQGSV
ncbi:MAG: peroxiredoxin [Flavobacteriales bacterium]